MKESGSARGTVLVETDYYTFTRIGDRHYLNVLCGGIGMYEVRILLNEEEMADYGEWGDYYIDGMARKIARDPGRYVKRHE